MRERERERHHKRRFDVSFSTRHFFTADDFASMSSETVKSWFQQNKLYAVGGLWGSAMISTFLYQHVFQASTARTSVKVIHSRLYSQAITLSALLAASGVEYYDRTHGERKVEEVDPFEYKAGGRRR